MQYKAIGTPHFYISTTYGDYLIIVFTVFTVPSV